MSKILRFEKLPDGKVNAFGKKQVSVSRVPCGCGEPIGKDHYWCPKRKWAVKDCPFINKRECDNFQSMCGGCL